MTKFPNCPWALDLLPFTIFFFFTYFSSHLPVQTCSGETMLNIQLELFGRWFYLFLIFLFIYFIYFMSHNLPALSLRSIGDCDRRIGHPCPIWWEWQHGTPLRGVSNCGVKSEPLGWPGAPSSWLPCLLDSMILFLDSVRREDLFVQSRFRFNVYSGESWNARFSALRSTQHSSSRQKCSYNFMMTNVSSLTSSESDL